MCEISPDHRFLAYSIYVMDKGFFTLCVKDLNAGSLHHKPRVDRVDTLAWSKDGLVLFYTVLNNSNRPSRYVMLWFNCNQSLISCLTWYFFFFFFKYGSQPLLIFFAFITRVFFSVLESSQPDTLLIEEFDDTAYLTIRGTKDYHFITVTSSSSKSLQVNLSHFLIFRHLFISLPNNLCACVAIGLYPRYNEPWCWVA